MLDSAVACVEGVGNAPARLVVNCPAPRPAGHHKLFGQAQAPRGWFGSHQRFSATLFDCAAVTCEPPGTRTTQYAML